MDSRQVLYYSPQHVVEIVDPETGDTKLTFDTKNSPLLAYSYSTNIRDTKGSFSLTLYPDDLTTGKHLLDQINTMDVVNIYEKIKGNEQVKYPSFTGIVKKRKYISQCEGNAIRRLVISGYSIAGLIDQLYINLDVNATSITKTAAADEATTFTIANITSPDNPPTIEDVVNKMWQNFLSLADKYKTLSTPKVVEYIQRFIGDSPFKFEDPPKLHYPIGNIFANESTQNFYSLLGKLFDQPVYEKFVCRDEDDGKMKVKIREVPFDVGKSWDKLARIPVEPVDVKGFDLTLTDDDVYTFFFSYVDGYPVQEDLSLKLAAQDVKEDNTLRYEEEKYKLYGYRPLFANFKGYALKTGEVDNGTQGHLQELNQRLRDWYSHLDEMLLGTITISCNSGRYNYSTGQFAQMPRTGERISFLGGEFYVEGVDVKWNYGGNTEATLTVSRGGKYDSGQFEPFEDIADKYALIEEAKETTNGA